MATNKVIISEAAKIRGGDSPWLVLWAVELDGIKYRQKLNYGWERWVAHKHKDYRSGYYTVGQNGHFRSVSSERIIELLDTIIAKHCLDKGKGNSC
jgi:hypothetical protein